MVEQPVEVFPTMNVALGTGFCCTEPHSEGQPEACVLAAECSILGFKVPGALQEGSVSFSQMPRLDILSLQCCCYFSVKHTVLSSLGTLLNMAPGYEISYSRQKGLRRCEAGWGIRK